MIETVESIEELDVLDETKSDPTVISCQNNKKVNRKLDLQFKNVVECPENHMINPEIIDIFLFERWRDFRYEFGLR